MSVIGHVQTLSALDSVFERFLVAHSSNITLPATASQDARFTMVNPLQNP